MMARIQNTLLSYTAHNDNRTLLEDCRSRKTRIWAEDLAHQIERKRFLKAWGLVDHDPVNSSPQS